MTTPRGAASWRVVAGSAGLVLLAAVAVAAVPTLLRQNREVYEWSASWGSTGSGPGEFQGPIGIAVDGSGFVYVSDSGNDRIQKFTADGRFVTEWGRTGRAPGELRRPMHMELVGDSLLYVAEYLNDRIHRFRLDGAAAGMLEEDTVTAGGALDAAGGVAVVPGSDEIWIADFFHHRVAAYGNDGVYRRRVGSSGRGLPGRIHYPTDVASGPDGTVYVADAYNHRIQRFSADGRRLDTWGGPLGLGIPGPWKGWFIVATGVHVDAGGRVFVADFYNDRIQAFDPSGKFVAQWGTSGSGAGAFDRPTDMVTGPDGRIYVVDFGNDRIQAFACRSCRP